MVCVGNQCYTKAELDHDIKEVYTLIRRSAPDGATAEKKIAEIAPKIAWDLVSNFMYSSVFGLEAEATGIVPNSEDINMAKMVKQQMAKRLGQEWDAYAAAWPGGADKCERAIFREARNKAYFRKEFSEKLKVTEEEMDRELEALKAANEECEATNRIYKAKVAEYRERLIASPPEFTNDDSENEALVEEGYSVNVFENSPTSYFDDEIEILAALQKLKPGEWSEIFDTDTTFDFYLLKEYHPKNFQSPALYSGVKISYPRDLGYLVPDRNRLRNDLRYIKNRQYVLPKAQELAEKFGVWYPNGMIWKKGKN